MRLQAVIGFALLASTANASENFYRLFDPPERVEDKAKAEVARVAKDCNYSEMSRIGPRPEQVARCNAAEEKLIALGSNGARAAIAAIDDESTRYNVRWRLYDVIARSADLAFVEPLVVALEREEARGLGNVRHFERQAIAQALETLTYAELKGTPAIQWREWANAHRGQAREQLYAERVAGARTDIAGGTVEQATVSARFLAMQPPTRGEGVRALKALLARPDLTHTQRINVEAVLGQVPEAPAQVAQKPAPNV
jgi:hypothetical protein